MWGRNHLNCFPKTIPFVLQQCLFVLVSNLHSVDLQFFSYLCVFAFLHIQLRLH